MPVLAISSNVQAPASSGTPITSITKVGVTARSPQSGNSVDTTVNFTSLNVGDLVVVVGGSGPSAGSSQTFPLAMSSNGATGWQVGAGPTAVNSGFGNADVSIWWGVVVSPMADTLTVSWSNNTAASWIDVYQFSTGISTNIWTVDKSSINLNTSSTTIAWPTLVPTGTGELYMGAALQTNTATAGSTSGYVYDKDTFGDINCYNVNVGASTSPTATQSPAGISVNAAVLFRAFNASATVSTNSVTLGTVPTGRMWVVSQIGYEILPVTTATNIVTSVTMNGRSVYTGSNGNGGSNQGPPYITVRVGDVMVVNWTNVPIGSSCIGNFFYNEYSANAQPSDIGGLV